MSAAEGSSAGRSPIDGKDVLVALVLGVAACALRYRLVAWGLLDGDEGYLLYGVQRLLDGELIYRDFERTYPPGLFALFAVLVRTFGNDFLTTRYVSWLLLGALAGFSYLLARRAAPRWAALFPAALVTALPPPWHKVFVPFALVVGLWVCAASVRTGWPGKTLVSGIVLGVLGTFRQDVAAFCILATAGTLLLREAAGRDRLRQLQHLLLGAAVVWLPILGYFAWYGGAGDMLEQVLLAGARVNEGIQLPYPPLAQFTTRPSRIALFYFPAAMVVVGAVLVALAIRRRQPRSEWLPLAQWTLLAALMHVQVLSRSDMSHLKQILLPPSLILAAAAGRLASAPLRTWRGALRWAALALLAVFAAAAIQHGYRYDWRPSHRAAARDVPLDHPRVAALLAPRRAEATARVVQVLQTLTRPGDPIFVAPYGPILYVLADRINPTRYDLVFPGHTASEEVQREIIRDLEDARLNVFVVQDMALDGRADRRFPHYTPLLARYLRDHFRRHSQIGPWIVLLRSES